MKSDKVSVWGKNVNGFFAYNTLSPDLISFFTYNNF